MPEVPKIVRERLRLDWPAGIAAHHPGPDLLSAFAEQVLLPAEREQVLQHLAVCEGCRAVVITALPALEVPLPASAPEPAAMSHPVLETKRSWFSRPLFGWRNLRWGALAAGIAVAGAVLLYHPENADRSAALKQAAPIANSQPSAMAEQKTAAPAAETNAISAERDKIRTARETPQIAANLEPNLSAQKKALTRAKEAEVPSMVVAENKLPANSSLAAKDKLDAADHATPGAKLPAAPSSSGKVEVEAAAGAVQTEDARLSASIASQTAQNLPLSARNESALPITRAKPPTAAEQAAPMQMAKAAPAAAGLVRRLDTSQALQLAGLVTDPSGAAVANAKVTVTNEKTGLSLSTATNQDGAYTLKDLPAGSYKLLAEASGFRAVSNSNVSLNPGVTARLDFRMPLEQAAEAVEVAGARQAVQTEDAKLNANLGSVKWSVSSGILRRSLDGGTSWQTVLTDGHLLCSAALGTEVWTGGKSGVLYHSLDNGGTWTQVHPSVDNRSLTNDVTAIQMRSATNIVLSTANGETWTASDGGKSWTWTRK